MNRVSIAKIFNYTAADVGLNGVIWDYNGSQMEVMRIADDFEIVFAFQLTPEQVRASLAILADYYRACGGAGLQPDFELSDVFVGEPVDALA